MRVVPQVVVFAILALAACSKDASVGPRVPSQIISASAITLGAVAGTAVATVPRVRVLSAGGAGVADVPITFTVSSGGGSISGANTVTDADGFASVGSWTLGAAVGANALVAASSAVAGASVTFTATASAGAPSTISFSVDSLLLDQWGDTARVTVTVRDANANIIPSPTLAWLTQDAAVANVAGGLATSVRTGRTLLQVSATSGSFPAIQATVPARVVLQRNPMCSPPSATVRGAVAGVASYAAAEILTNLSSPTWDGYRSIAVDFDNDGDDDVVRFEYSFPSSTPYSGATRYFKNDGGVLRDSSAAYLPAGLIADHPRDFEVADFDGNGSPELLLIQHGFDASPYPGAPNIFLQLGAGVISNVAAVRFPGLSSAAFSHGSSSADIDCDGDLDVVEMILTPAHTNRLWKNNGAGTFSNATSQAPAIAGVAGQRWQEVAFVDFDGDGDPDIYLGARSGPGWNEDVLLINDGFGNFRRSAAVQLPAPRYAAAHGINQAKSADFDGDGHMDLLVFEIPQPFSSVSAVRLWLNNGDGTFTDASAPWGLPAECTGEIIEPLYVRDMNGDGWPDVVLPPGCPNYGGPGILTNTGSGFSKLDFSVFEPWLANDWATPVDIDGNGRIALFFGERGGNPVLVRRP